MQVETQGGEIVTMWSDGTSTRKPAMCQCEHEGHFDGTAHKYCDIPAGDRKVVHVGRVCNDCADRHDWQDALMEGAE